MGRPRARAVGLRQYIIDGRRPDVWTERMERDARKAERDLPPARSRKCLYCATMLSRYTSGDVCQRHRDLLHAMSKAQREAWVAEHTQEEQ
jgi:hypothetical protein